MELLLFLFRIGGAFLAGIAIAIINYILWKKDKNIAIICAVIGFLTGLCGGLFLAVPFTLLSALISILSDKNKEEDKSAPSSNG
jgi:uncharacterized membrane protein